MAKKMRLIDANELTDRLSHTTMVAYPNLFPGLLAAVEIVDDSPTVDAVPVVRCKGCGFASADLTECTIKFDQDGEPLTVDPMYYCADGKPRRDGRKS